MLNTRLIIKKKKYIYIYIYIYIKIKKIKNKKLKNYMPFLIPLLCVIYLIKK